MLLGPVQRGVVIQAVRGIGRLLLADSDAEVKLTGDRLAVALMSRRITPRA